MKQAHPHTKIPQLSAHLRELAFARGAHARLPTIRELCTTLGTSRATLNEVLDELEAQHVIYRKSGSGIFVSPKLLRKTIAILLDASLLRVQGASPFWGTLWGHFAQAARQRTESRDEYYSLHLVIKPVDAQIPLPEEIISAIEGKRLHGVLVVGLNSPTSQWIISQGVPCVTFAGYGPWNVVQDNPELIRLGVSQLAQQGCRRIGLWLPLRDTRHVSPEHAIAWAHRYAEDTLRYFLADRNLSFYPELVRTYQNDQSPAQASLRDTHPALQEQGFMIAQTTFSASSTYRPDGVIIIDDMLTEGVLSGLLSQGIRLGQDVKIVSHTNHGSFVTWERLQGMTLIEFQPQEIVWHMFHLLDQLMQGQTPQQARTLIQPRLRRNG